MGCAIVENSKKSSLLQSLHEVGTITKSKKAKVIIFIVINF